MKTGWMLAALVALAVWTAGCAKPRTSGFTVGVDSDVDGSLQEVLQVDNAKMARLLVVENIHVSQTKNGLMKASVRLGSRLNRTYTAQSKFAWFDEEGLEIDPDGDPWRPLVLQGRESRPVQGVAPNASAVSFRLRVREGERSKWIIR